MGQFVQYYCIFFQKTEISILINESIIETAKWYKIMTTTGGKMLLHPLIQFN